MNKSIKKVLLVSIVLYLIIFVVSLFLGRYVVFITDFFCNNNRDFELEKSIILNLRLPRAIMATLAGVSLSLSGLIYQETFQNDLVSPDLLGVTQGAGVGASIAIVLCLSNYLIALFAFLFGAITVLITVLISKVFRNKNNITLILSGLIVGSFMSSVLTTIKYFVNPETQLATIVYWLMGSFANIEYNNIIFVLPIVLIMFMVLLLISHRINLIALGKEETETKGINYIFYRNMIIVIATILTATTVSCCGTIGWVGLIIPHITKTIIGRDVNKSLPICAIFGAIFTLIADILSRTLVQSEIPISAITGIIGSIIFTLILIYYSKMKYGYSLNYSVCNKKELFNEAHSCQLNVNNKNKIISIDNLGFKYNNQKDYELKNITFGIYENDIILLYGTNGSGKTTSFKCFSKEIEPDEGSIIIGGVNIKDFTQKQPNVGYCPQFDCIFEYLTVEENLKFYARMKGVKIKYLDQLVKAMITL